MDWFAHRFFSAGQPSAAVARPPHPCPFLIFLPPPAAAACEQDFEAVTPNLLARTVETVEGGGVVVLLLSSLDSLSQLYSLTMDVHSRLRTESHQEVTGERCARCAALGRAGFCCATIVVYAWLFCGVLSCFSCFALACHQAVKLQGASMLHLDCCPPAPCNHPWRSMPCP